MLNKFSLEQIDLKCPKTWKLIGDGDTVGCFQIESRLGRQLCKKIKPRNIMELSDVIALMRPSCLEAKLEDGKSITDHYILRHNRQEPIDYYHPALRDILKQTKGLLVYQEQMMKIAQEIAGFSLVEADNLRKAAGKKKVELMQALKDGFIQGCILKGIVNQEEAEQIFDWIEKSQRYSFNLSHSVSYAYLTYQTAYAKANHKIDFYRSYLNHSCDKQKPLQEIDRLIQDAKKSSIHVRIPDIVDSEVDFVIKGGRIYFGIGHIKTLGYDSAVEILQKRPENLDKMSWDECLVFYLANIKPAKVKAMIACGAFDKFCRRRKQMLYQHDNFLHLKEKEIEYIRENLHKHGTLIGTLKSLLKLPTGKNQPITNQRRHSAVIDVVCAFEFPPYSLDNNVEEIANWEASYLGTNITCSKFDVICKGTEDNDCADFEQTNKNHFKCIAQIKNIREIKTKATDEEMAFCTASDDTGEVESVVVFPSKWAQYKHLLENFEILRIRGYKKEDSLILLECERIE